MTIYFKATRPDGTDFRTGTVDYAAILGSGNMLPLLVSKNGEYKCCTNSVYHASDISSETLIGGSWPCRLFEVTGKSVAQEGHKYGFQTLSVVREVSAWQALGPNGEAVASLIDRASQLTSEEVESLDAARNAAWAAAMTAARNAAWAAAMTAARTAAWDAAWDAARTAARNAAGDAAWDAARTAARNAAGDAAMTAARTAARDAAVALVVRDLITEEQFEILYDSWRSVIGETGD